MIDYLPDEILRDHILCRLPCYRTAVRCKAVSKRWRSIISDSLFITQGFLTHREIKEEEPSSIFLLTMKSTATSDGKLVAAMIAPPRFQRTTLRSPFSSLQFLPYHSRPLAIFKDLILSYDVNSLTGLHVYYISNPFTKQWIALPPSQIHQNQVIWAALMYRDGRGFRVVVAHSYPKASAGDPFTMINLLIYISETCQWRNIYVKLQFNQSSFDYYGRGDFKGIVCKGMVCIHVKRHSDDYFGVFNPFDVTDTSHGTLTAIDLPPTDGKINILLESDGKLVVMTDHNISLRFDYRGNSAYLSPESCIWKLDMRRFNNNNNDKELPRWELLSTHQDERIEIKGSMLTSSDHFTYGSPKFEFVAVHPSKEHLVYLIEDGGSSRQGWLILFDTKSKTLRHLTKTVPPHELLISTSPKLDIPCWPTPIPIQ